jgi:hypothetical protein
MLLFQALIRLQQTVKYMKQFAANKLLFACSGSPPDGRCCCCCRSNNFKVTGVGVEDLQIEFPWTPYLGHHEGKAAQPAAAL